MRAFQLNFQQSFGGAEAYTAFCCRAASALGLDTTLLVHPSANFWGKMDLGIHTRIVSIASEADLLATLAPTRAQPVWLLTHAPLPAVLKHSHAGLLVTGFAHMPVQGRDPVRAYGGYDMLFAVSGWVRDGLCEQNLPVWSEPMYGVADAAHQDSTATLARNSCYDWDSRKLRDRLFSYLEPLVEAIRPHPSFVRKPNGLTLGIVSRITPIKQFPRLFMELAPVLANHPDVHLEIFGAGGFASIRDLHAALEPCASQVRFWGQQRNVGAIYAQIDYLLTGLPEKEALGLNVIEAQACGTPVLAVNAPPFTETVLDRETGYLFTDPREDAGADFGRLLDRLRTTARPDPRLAAGHLKKFSFDAFVERLRPVVAWAQAQLDQP